jgi:hypothetical protein
MLLIILMILPTFFFTALVFWCRNDL